MAGMNETTSRLDKMSPLTVTRREPITDQTKTSNMHISRNSGMRKLANQTTQVMPIEIRDEQARISKQNTMLDSKIMSVRSRIPMNKKDFKDQNAQQDKYRCFASKYGRGKPKLDPLVTKRLYREVTDTDCGQINMVSMNNLSQTSIGLISVDYNEGSAVAKRNAMVRRPGGGFLRKSQSISGIA